MKRTLTVIVVLALASIALELHASDSAVSPNTISLPDGPGSISGLGEEFSPSANSGTAHYGVSISVPEGSGGLKPSIRLSYDGGRGNSELGFGWSMNLPSIQLQTDKGLPRYVGADAFIYRDGMTSEELVPLADGSFRLKTESSFIKAKVTGDGWEVRTKSGVVYTLGTEASSRVQDSTGTKVFAWLVNRIEDTNGNAIAFAWTSDSNRKYLDRITYNDYGAASRCEVIFGYEARQDALADYRAGFPMLTAKRLSKIEVRRGSNTVRSYALSYDAASVLSRLVSITLTGSDGASTMPSLSFAYAPFSPEDSGVVEMYNPPGQGLVSAGNALVDFNADALPDLIVTQAGDYSYYINEDGGNWSNSQSLAASPSYDLTQSGVRLADLDGDGASDLIIARTDGNKFLPGTGQSSWSASVDFDMAPVGFDLSDSNTKFVDLNGDRMIDVLRTGASGNSAWIHEGAGNFERLSSLPKIDTSEDVLLSDSKVHLADINGDGLVDVARLRSESLIYWPSTGYGLFDDPVVVSGMHHVADESRLRLADINGDGLADVIYLGVSYVSFRMNLGDGSLGDETSISGTPAADPITTAVRLADMNGNGTTDIAWVDVSGGPGGAWQYLDLIGEQHTGLITRVDNGLGKIVSVEYESTTAQMVRDAAAGNPWAETMPFPMSVISKVSVEDSLGWKSTTEYSYRDGYYDGAEREFMGFAKSSKSELGDASIEGLVTVSEFDVGRTDESLKGKVLLEEHVSTSGAVYRKVVNEWESAVLALGMDGRDVLFPSMTSTVTSFVENSSHPKYVRVDYVYDDHGNVVEELKHGEVSSVSDDGSTPVGDDEIFISRAYVKNESAWILDRVTRESVYDSAGNKLSESVSYYDGAMFQGLPFGQVDRGNLMRKEAWLGAENGYVAAERFRRDAWGNMTAMLDAEGGRREMAYDASHVNPVRERIFTGADVLDFSSEYDAIFGKVVSYTDPNGAVTSFSYDPFGRLKSVVKPGDSADLPTTSYSYAVSSPVSAISTSLREVSGQNGTLDSHSYVDGLGRTRAELMEDDGGTYAVTQAIAYNSRGKKTFAANPFRANSFADVIPMISTGVIPTGAEGSLAGTSYSYDAMGRPISSINSDGSFALVKYIPMGELVSDENDTDPGSPHFGTPTTKLYDGQGRVTSISFKSNDEDVTTSFGYDAGGNVLSIVDPSGNMRQQAYDGLGRMIALDDPNAGRRAFVYDDAGKLIKKLKPDGYAIAYKYEPTTGRVIAKNSVTNPGDDSWEVKYHYDAPSGAWGGHGPYLKGKLAWVEDEAGKEYYGYDARGRLIAKRRTIGSNVYDLSYAYGAADRMMSSTYPDGFSVDISYDGRGLIDSVGSYLVGRTYNAAGQVETELLGSGATRGYEYDIRGRLVSLASTGQNGETIQSFTYDYDAAGNILGMVDGRSGSEIVDQSQTLVYDDLYRLARADVSGGSISWSYDAVGNITGRTTTLDEPRFDVPEMKYGEGAAGPYAMTSAGDSRYEYDINGNLISMPEQTLTYDPEDRLSKVTKSDGTLVEMVYDHSGQRKVKRVSGVEGGMKEYLYVDPLYEVRDGKPFRYIWAGGRRIARIDTSLAEPTDE